MDRVPDENEGGKNSWNGRIRSPCVSPITGIKNGNRVSERRNEEDRIPTHRSDQPPCLPGFGKNEYRILQAVSPVKQSSLKHPLIGVQPEGKEGVTILEEERIQGGRCR